MALTLPDELVAEVASFDRWLPVILRISLEKFETHAAIVANEVVQFLKSNPSSEEVAHFQMSSETQARLEKMLEQHKLDKLDKQGQAELLEIERLNHHLLLLKADIARAA